MKKMEDMSKEKEEKKRERDEETKRGAKEGKGQHQGRTGAGKTIRRGRGRAPGSKRGRNRSA